jgi:hypothetical protein
MTGRNKMNDTAESFELTAPVDSLPVANDPMSILAAALERGIDTDQLSKLMDLQERYDKNEARKAYFEALAASAIDMPVVTKDRINLQYDSQYSSKENMINTIGPHLSKFGLSHRWQLDQSAGIAVTCVLSHVAGHSESVTVKGPPDTSGKKNELQQIKSTITYLEIVSFEALTGTASQSGSMNDDGNIGVPVLTAKEKAVRANRESQPLATKKQRADMDDYLAGFKDKLPESQRAYAQLKSYLDDDNMTRTFAAQTLINLKEFNG